MAKLLAPRFQCYSVSWTNGYMAKWLEGTGDEGRGIVTWLNCLPRGLGDSSASVFFYPPKLFIRLRGYG